MENRRESRLTIFCIPAVLPGARVERMITAADYLLALSLWPGMIASGPLFP